MLRSRVCIALRGALRCVDDAIEARRLPEKLLMPKRYLPQQSRAEAQAKATRRDEIREDPLLRTWNSDVATAADSRLPTNTTRPDPRPIVWWRAELELRWGNRALTRVSEMETAPLPLTIGRRPPRSELCSSIFRDPRRWTCKHRLASADDRCAG